MLHDLKLAMALICEFRTGVGGVSYERFHCHVPGYRGVCRVGKAIGHGDSVWWAGVAGQMGDRMEKANRCVHSAFHWVGYEKPVLHMTA